MDAQSLRGKFVEQNGTGAKGKVRGVYPDGRLLVLRTNGVQEAWDASTVRELAKRDERTDR